MTEKERMLAGKICCPFKVGDNTWEKSREVLVKARKKYIAGYVYQARLLPAVIRSGKV